MRKTFSIIFVFAATIFLTGCQLIPPRQPNKTQASPVTDEDICGSAGCNQEEVLPSSPSAEATGAGVSLPTSEDIVKTFFNLINEKRIPETVAMLSAQASPDETSKQTWGVNFASLKTVSVKSIEPWSQESWSETTKTYKVIVNIVLEQGDFSYGWYSGENTRWLEIVKNPQSNLWQINAIASGP